MNQINPYRHGGEALAFDGFGNRSRSFDGVDDVVDLGNTNSRTTNQTFCAWVKADAFDSTFGNSYFSKWDGNILNGKEWLLWLSWVTPMKPEFRITQSNGTLIICTSPTNIVLNQWTHIAGLVDANNIYLYIDGSLVATTAYDGTSSVVSNSIATIGGMNYSATNAHNASGNISDCRIYDTDLTASQISDIYNGTNITTNLVGHWLTDADNLLDAAGTNHGTNYGTKYSYDNPSPPVEFGSASRSFNGSSDYVNLGQTTDNAIFTASAWIKADSLNASFGAGIFGKWQSATNGSWLLYTPSSGNDLSFVVRNSANDTNYICASGIGLTVGQWTHIAGVADGTNLNIYVNGVSAASIAYNGTINNPTSDTVIGAYNNTLNNNHYVDGKIADARYYDTDLTASQVSDLYAGTDVQTNLVGHWLTDNDDVEDKAGTNDGTNFGSTYSYDNPPMDLIPSRQASRSFDGVNDYITVQDGSWIPTGAQTWACWIKPDADSIVTFFNHNVGSGDQRSVNIITYTGGMIYAQLSPDGVTTIDAKSPSSTYVTGEWIHVAFTFTPSSSTGLKLYINGSLETVSNVSSMASVFNSTADVGIGANGLGQAPFQGNICDCRIYDTDLTSSQILAIYNGTTDRTNLIGQWLTNSDDVIDHAGTNDGTNIGSTYSNDSPS